MTLISKLCNTLDLLLINSDSFLHFPLDDYMYVHIAALVNIVTTS